MKPQPTDGMDQNFGLHRNQLYQFVPLYKDVPEEFKQRSNSWVKLVEDLFFHGGSLQRLREKDGVDRKAAIGHIATVLHTIDPSFGHEHKTAACAYLLDLWFEEPTS